MDRNEAVEHMNAARTVMGSVGTALDNIWQWSTALCGSGESSGRVQNRSGEAADKPGSQARTGATAIPDPAGGVQRDDDGGQVAGPDAPAELATV